MLHPRNIDGFAYFAFPHLERSPHFIHAVTPRQPSCGVAESEALNLRLLERLGVPRDRLLRLHQVHGTETLGPEADLLPAESGERPQADGWILTRPGRFGVIRTADCVPVIALLPERKAVGLFHSGWRGTCGRIVERGLGRLLEATGADAGELMVAIGPAIRRCCYEVGEEVFQAFAAAGHQTDGLRAGSHLDLVEAVRRQARAAGAGTILDSGMCTVCRNDLFYSYRKEKTPLRTWTVAGWVE